MAKTVLSIITVLGFCIASLAQDAAYYKAIQKTSHVFSWRWVDTGLPVSAHLQLNTAKSPSF